MQRIKTGLVLLVILLNIVLAANCATLTRRRTQRIPVTSSPIGATVIVNGQQQGVTPLELHLARKEKIQVIRIESPGYHPLEIRMARRRSANGVIGNIMLGSITGIAIASAYWLLTGGGIFHDASLHDYVAGAVGGAASFLLYMGIDSKNRGYEWKPAELTVTLTKADGPPRVDTLLIDADDLQNVKWIRVRRD